jgi:hypothetical protein
MGKIARVHWINSTGLPTDGTPIDDQELQDLQTAIEAEFYTANHTGASTRAIIDNVIAGVPFEFGGDPNAAIFSDMAYPSGATTDKIVVGTGIWRVDTVHLQEGIYQLEAMALMYSNEVNAGDVADDYGVIALFDLTGATPDVPITNSVINGTGQGYGVAPVNGVVKPKLLRSGNILPANLPAPFTVRDLAVKAWGPGAAFYNIRFFRVD